MLRLHTNPLKIFKLRPQQETHIEVDLDEEWVIPLAPQHSKAQWTPFAGFKIKGCVKRVVLRGETVFVDGKVTNTSDQKHTLYIHTYIHTYIHAHLEI